jgi:hypothetical protein
MPACVRHEDDAGRHLPFRIDADFSAQQMGWDTINSGTTFNGVYPRLKLTEKPTCMQT